MNCVFLSCFPKVISSNPLSLFLSCIRQGTCACMDIYCPSLTKCKYHEKKAMCTWLFSKFLIIYLIMIINKNKFNTKVIFDYNIGTVVNILKYMNMALRGQWIQNDVCNTIFNLSLYSSLCSPASCIRRVSQACKCCTLYAAHYMETNCQARCKVRRRGINYSRLRQEEQTEGAGQISPAANSFLLHLLWQRLPLTSWSAQPFKEMQIGSIMELHHRLPRWTDADDDDMVHNIWCTIYAARYLLHVLCSTNHKYNTIVLSITDFSFA